MEMKDNKFKIVSDKDMWALNITRSFIKAKTVNSAKFGSLHGNWSWMVGVFPDDSMTASARQMFLSKRLARAVSLIWSVEYQ